MRELEDLITERYAPEINVEAHTALAIRMLAEELALIREELVTEGIANRTASHALIERVIGDDGTDDAGND